MRVQRALALLVFGVYSWIWATFPEAPWQVSGCGLVCAVLAFASTYETDSPTDGPGSD